MTYTVYVKLIGIAPATAHAERFDSAKPLMQRLKGDLTTHVTNLCTQGFVLPDIDQLVDDIMPLKTGPFYDGKNKLPAGMSFAEGFPSTDPAHAGFKGIVVLTFESLEHFETFWHYSMLSDDETWATQISYVDLMGARTM